jgi:threonine dehydrogenase-like Zn-dependent dehydrogenase
MKALRFERALRLSDVPLPEPGAGEVLVRVERSGICKTDLEITRGYMGFVGTLGHEFCGVVDRAENPALVGLFVAGEINLWCGVCDVCRRGERTHCPSRSVLGIVGRDGAHAEYLALPERNLHRVPEGISVEAATLIEPLAACCRILEQRPIAEGESVVVVGDGKLAFLAAQVLRTATKDVRVLGKHREKLKMFEEVGIDGALFANRERRADLVIECSGSPSGFETAARVVRPRGAIVLKTTCAEPIPIDTSRVVVDEISVIGSRCGPFDRAIDLLERRIVNVAPLIQETLPLSSGVEAFARAEAPGARKILLDPSA